MITDYHCHLLPEMDDGAESAPESAAMLRTLREQGIGRVVATPHYYGLREAPETFFRRRERAFSLLAEVCGEPPVLAGAEVALFRGISEKPFLPELTMNGSRLILLEPPHGPPPDWLDSEIFGVANNWGLTPMLAHVDRYLRWYKRGEMERLLSVEGVLQINNSALGNRVSRKFALDLIAAGFPVVFGSDAHGMSVRTPDFEDAISILKKHLTAREYEVLLTASDHFFENGRL